MIGAREMAEPVQTDKEQRRLIRMAETISKALPYMRAFEEENPARGWRAIRIGLDRPGMLRGQVRALLRAGAGRDTRIMFPMVATAALLPYTDSNAWISMVLVAGEYRRRGLATALLRGAMADLTAAKLVPVLDATPDGRAKLAAILSTSCDDFQRAIEAAVDEANAALEAHIENHAIEEAA